MTDALPYIFSVIAGLVGWWANSISGRVKELEQRVRDIDKDIGVVRQEQAVAAANHGGVLEKLTELSTAISRMQEKLDNVLYGMASCTREQHHHEQTSRPSPK